MHRAGCHPALFFFTLVCRRLAFSQTSAVTLCLRPHLRLGHLPYSLAVISLNAKGSGENRSCPRYFPIFLFLYSSFLFLHISCSK
nr:hypothetical protein JQQKEAMO_JQQKEAMO_CDS_0007 [Microvirus sp.]